MSYNVLFFGPNGSLSPRLCSTFDADLAQVILKSRGQVAAGLSVTRSFGDVDFKVPAEVVTAVPELSAFAIDPEAGCGGDLEVTCGGAVGWCVMWCPQTGTPGLTT